MYRSYRLCCERVARSIMSMYRGYRRCCERGIGSMMSMYRNYLPAVL